MDPGGRRDLVLRCLAEERDPRLPLLQELDLGLQSCRVRNNVMRVLHHLRQLQVLRLRQLLRTRERARLNHHSVLNLIDARLQAGCFF